MKRIWAMWINYTKKIAEEKAFLDMALFGTGITIKRWWGYEHISPVDTCQIVVTNSRTKFYGIGDILK